MECSAQEVSILFNESRAVRCSLFSSYRVKLTIMTSNARTLLRQPVAAKTNHRLFSCIAVYLSYIILSCLFRYLSASQLVERIKHLKSKNSILIKYANCLREKLSRVVEQEGVCLDDEASGFVKGIADSSECQSYISTMPGSSFHHIFWMQQIEASNKTNA